MIKKIGVLACLVISCRTNQPNTMNKILVPAQFDVQGHRGCRGLLPENTIPAFIEAIKLGVTTLEMDIVFTKDLQAIVSHEPFFNHEISTQPNGNYITKATEKNFNIFNMNYEEVIKYDVGLKPHPRFIYQQKIPAIKPLLAAVIDSAEAYTKSKNIQPIYYNIETKTTVATDDLFHPKPALFVDLLIQVLQQKNIVNRVTIQSFDIRTLQYLHQHYPSLSTAYLVEVSDFQSIEESIKKLGFVTNIFSPDFNLLNKKMIEECHSKNIKVIPWTINNQNEMQQLILLGIDGLITDYPNVLQQQIRQ